MFFEAYYELLSSRACIGYLISAVFLQTIAYTFVTLADEMLV